MIRESPVDASQVTNVDAIVSTALSVFNYDYPTTRIDIGLLVFPSLAGCRALCPDAGPEATLADLIGRPPVRACIGQALQRLAGQGTTGSSTYPARALLLAEPPSGDANEITDKGYINQRAVLMKRADLVERLHAEPPGADVIVCAGR